MKHTIESEKELILAFRPKDRKNVEIPQRMRFPILIQNYLAWTEPSGVRVYLVFKKAEWKNPIGVAFRRDQQGSLASPSRMCEWCHSCAPSDQIALLTARVDSKKRAGVILCLNLDCIEKMNSLAKVSGQNLEKMTEQHLERMVRFCDEALQFRGE